MTPHINQQVLDKIPALAARFRLALAARPGRDRPRILIVEDQLFSRRLLQGLLQNDFVVDIAVAAKDAMHSYFENAPDIAFVDIELTDDSGHTLAQFMKAIDKDAFIVMVTANHAIEDVALAKSNQVDGFIAKPYNKAAIYGSIGTYYERHPERRPHERICQS
ncbi:MAG: response regulator [Alphaproteobacteria bacterium]|nr:response regulator [Alphaproteobacteria bacterium]